MRDAIRMLLGIVLATLIACGDDTTRGKPDLAAASDMSVAVGVTGSACAQSADCMGNMAMCLTTPRMGAPWPGGYCTSLCLLSRNGAGGVDGECPGGAGTCTDVGSGNGEGLCTAICTARDATSMPAPCRDQYSCFNFGDAPSCFPTTFSACDPPGSGGAMTCPQDGGIPNPLPDGAPADAQPTTAGETCIQVGQDPVGACFAVCDPFAQNCPDGNNGNAQGCFVDATGVGSCSSFLAAGDGAACMYLNGCSPGLGCNGSEKNGTCRAYCGGPNSVACPSGQSCVQVDPKVPTTRVGICQKM